MKDAPRFKTAADCLAKLESDRESVSVMHYPEYARERRRNKERQPFCMGCKRYRWDSEQCNHFVQGRIVKRRASMKDEG